jgi:hypothetical protein
MSLFEFATVRHILIWAYLAFMAWVILGYVIVGLAVAFDKVDPGDMADMPGGYSPARTLWLVLTWPVVLWKARRR